LKCSKNPKWLSIDWPNYVNDEDDEEEEGENSDDMEEGENSDDMEEDENEVGIATVRKIIMTKLRKLSPKMIGKNLI
jgi:hypothetical protein